MTYIKKTAVLIVVLALAMMFQLSVITASAEVSAYIAAPEAVSRGESFEVTLSFEADAAIGLVETDLVFDDSVASFTSGSASGSGGVLHVKYVSDRENTSVSVPLTFMAVAPGALSFSLSNCTVSSAEGAPVGNPSAQAAVTVNDDTVPESEDEQSENPPEESSSVPNKDENGIPRHGVLKSITVYEGELIPAFSPLIYDYVVKVGHDVEVFEVDAEPMSEDDYIWFDGSKKLSDTGTVRTIRVYDDNGNDNTYKIVVQRAPAPETAEAAVFSEEESSAAQSAVVTAPAAEQPSDEEKTADADSLSSSRSSSKDSSKESGASGMSELRSKLMPWLLAILGILVVALCIIVSWLKNKSERKRRKIKSSSGKK